MPRIYVDFDGFRQLGPKIQSAASKIDSIQGEFQRTVQQLDWDVQYESNISDTAGKLSQKLQGYTKSLNDYQQFLNTAYTEYKKLDSYSYKLETKRGVSTNYAAANTVSNPTFWETFTQEYGPKIIKSFGNVGKAIGLVGSISNASSWIDWAKAGQKGTEIISKVAKDYNNYKKIGRAVGTRNAVSSFFKKQFGFRSVGHASTASSPSARFYNNLHNTTSPFNIGDAFAPLTGKKGFGTAAIAWAGVALSGISNGISNIEEQKAKNGAMSTERVVAETISETAIDTAVTYGGSALVGAAIATATGVVAAPVVVAAATGAAVVGINAGVKALTGQTATEWVSDFVIDTTINVGKGIKSCAKAVGNWFGNLSFSW